MTTTRWQIVVRNGTPSSTIQLQFSARRTKRALYLAMVANGHMIADLAKLPEDDSEGFTWNSKAKAWEFGAWQVCFSGLTELDVKRGV